MKSGLRATGRLHVYAFLHNFTGLHLFWQMYLLCPFLTVTLNTLSMNHYPHTFPPQLFISPKLNGMIFVACSSIHIILLV